MNGHQRRRSPSAGQAGHLRSSASSTSPHPMLDQSAASYNHHFDDNSLNKQQQQQHFNATGNTFDPTFTTDFSNQAQYSLDPSFNAFQGQQQQQQHNPQLSQTTDIATQGFYQQQGVSPHGSNPGFDFNQSSNHVSPNALSQHTSPTDSAATDTFPSFDLNTQGYDQNASLDPSLLGFDPSQLDLLPQQNNFDPSASLNPMATTMQHQSTTPPHLLPDMARRQSNSPHSNTSPNFAQTGFQSMNRPRNASESLDPSSAWNAQGQNNDWMGIGGYRQNRTPSDQYSEASHSNQASPYLPTLDSFDHSSPLMNSQQDPTFNDALGLGGFSLNDQHPTLQQQQSFHSPGHSPGHSPRLMAQPQALQQALPAFTAENNFGLQSGLNGQIQYQQPSALETFPDVYANETDAFPSLSQGNSPGAVGEASQMSPPEINIDYAPDAKAHNNTKTTQIPSLIPEDTLSPPPARSQSRTRHRSKSDTHASSRPTSPGLNSRGRAPSLQAHNSFEGKNSLSPFDAAPPSRSPSPSHSHGRGRGSSLSGSLKRSTSSASASSQHSADHRDYILDLASKDPSARSPSAHSAHLGESTSNNGSKRSQKHPATFQCTLCPKRFTRAYNLRSHLRTHTDERPFVCTVCGKAFARQHDRKRHEGLHSGEKKFVCKGSLTSGGGWGCGRRFARADALGRHFRSEAGRVCIKPLLDEEAAERQKVWLEEQQQRQQQLGMPGQPMMMQQLQQQQQPQPQSMDAMFSGQGYIPAALLQQYPALAGLDWGSMAPGNNANGLDGADEDYISGRSSFDAGASSGGEYYDDVSENEMGGGGYQTQQPGMGIGTNNMQNMTGMPGFPPHGQQRQAGDYLGDFEGR